jgi:hypothetical protein
MPPRMAWGLMKYHAVQIERHGGYAKWDIIGKLVSNLDRKDIPIAHTVPGRKRLQNTI